MEPDHSAACRHKLNIQHREIAKPRQAAKGTQEIRENGSLIDNKT